MFEKIESTIFHPRIWEGNLELGWNLTDGFIWSNRLRPLKLARLLKPFNKKEVLRNPCFKIMRLFRIDNCYFTFFNNELVIVPRHYRNGYRLKTMVYIWAANKTVICFEYIFQGHGISSILEEVEKTADKYMKRTIPYEEFMKTREGMDFLAEDYDRGSEEWRDGNSIISTYRKSYYGYDSKYNWGSVKWIYPELHIVENLGIHRHDWDMWNLLHWLYH